MSSDPPPPPPTMNRDPRPAKTVPWSASLCGCCPNYFGRFCITFWCPWYTMGQVSEIIDRGSSSCIVNAAVYFILMTVTGHARCFSSYYRIKMRKQYALEGNRCMDCIYHCFCESCALTQEYHELQNRGFDVSLGWARNAERQNREVPMAPVVQPGMSR